MENKNWRDAENKEKITSRNSSTVKIKQMNKRYRDLDTNTERS